jgi:hypothetical protein
VNAHKAKMIAVWAISVAIVGLLIGMTVSLYDSVLRHI